MKKLSIYLFLVFSILSYSSIGNAQDILADGNVWNMSNQGFSPTISYFSLRIQGDSMVDNQSYKILQRTSDVTDESSWATHKLLREDDQGRVYILESGGEKLQYDFNLNIGDTYEADVDFSCLLEVTAIDTITLNNGEERKRLKIEAQSGFGPVDYWIEGIGSTYGIIAAQWHLHCATDFGEQLKCFSAIDGLVQYPENPTVCWEDNTTVEEIKLEDNIEISPNPFTDYLSIYIEQEDVKIQHLSIYSSTGMKVEDMEVNTLIINLNTSSFSKGIYFVLLEDDSGNAYSQKLIKR